jgi:hypothetical protein
MDTYEGTESLASLKQSIHDSEVSLRKMKETIEVVDARLRHSYKNDDAQPLSVQNQQ